MQTCINVLVQICTSAYFGMGLFMKAFEITWAKPMYMKYNLALIWYIVVFVTLLFWGTSKIRLLFATLLQHYKDKHQAKVLHHLVLSLMHNLRGTMIENRK